MQSLKIACFLCFGFWAKMAEAFLQPSTQIELVSVYRHLLAHRELAKALDKEMNTDADGLARGERGMQLEYKVSLGNSGSSAMQ